MAHQLILATNEEMEDYQIINNLDFSEEQVEFDDINPNRSAVKELQKTEQDQAQLDVYPQMKSSSYRSNKESLMVYYLVKRFLTKLSISRRQRLFFQSKHFSIVNDKASENTKSLETLTRRQRAKQINIFQSICGGIANGFRGFLKFLPIIYPQSVQKIILDLILCLVLIYFFIMIPIELAFDNYVMFTNIGLAVTSLFLFFLVIIYLLRMNTVYFEYGQPVEDRSLLFTNYFKKGMIIDGISILVIASGFINAYFIESRWIGAVQILFITQIRYFTQIVRNVEESIHMSKTSSALLNLAKLILALLYFLHLFSCLWYYIGDYSNQQGYPNWLELRSLEGVSGEVQYLDSFYFSCVTMISVGYGDIVPQNTLEKICTIIFMFTTCIQLSFSVNTVGEILNSISLSSENTTEKIRIINKYMNMKKISFDLQYQIREYMKIYWRQQYKEDLQEEDIIIQSLSENLRNKLVYESYHSIIDECSLFKDTFTNETKNKLINLLKTVYIPPEQIITSQLSQFNEQCLCYIERGDLNFYTNSQTEYYQFKEGQYFGIDDFLTGQQPTLQYKSLSFVKLIVLTRSDFISVIKENSKDYELFCSQRDRLLNQQIESQTKCTSCNCHGHDMWNCPIVHFVVDKERVIKSEQFGQKQTRQKFERTRIKNQFFALSDNWLLCEISSLFKTQLQIPIIRFYNNNLSDTQQIVQETQFQSSNNNLVGEYSPFKSKTDVSPISLQHQPQTSHFKMFKRRTLHTPSIFMKSNIIKMKFQKIVRKVIKINQASRNFRLAKYDSKTLDAALNQDMMRQVSQYFLFNSLEENLSKKDYEDLYFLKMKLQLLQKIETNFDVKKEYQFYLTHNNLSQSLFHYRYSQLETPKYQIPILNPINSQIPYTSHWHLQSHLRKKLVRYMQFPNLYFEKFSKSRKPSKKKGTFQNVLTVKALLMKKYKDKDKARKLIRKNAISIPNTNNQGNFIQLRPTVKINRILPEN